MTAVRARRIAPAPVDAGPRKSRAGFDAGVRIATGAALWVGLLVVAGLWVAGGGLRAMTDWASALTSAGRLAGLTAADLMLVQVLAMARIPPVERAFGQDRLARLHRLTGFTSLNLLLAHIVLVTWGYAAGDVISIPVTFWRLVTGYPGVLLALAAAAMMLLIAVTSVRAARRRLRYESWHLLHLYAYLGAGLALPHQLWTGQEFLTSTAATVYWWTLWGMAAAAVLTWRIGLPLWRTLRHRPRVTSVVAEGDRVYSVYLTGRRLDRLPVRAGQFFGWRFLGRAGWTRGNPYSLSAAPDGRSLRITVQAAGDGSAGIPALRPGTRAVIEGPYGRLTGRARTRRKVALIGAGVGITPLRALAEGLAYGPGEAVVLHRFTDRPLFEREFQVLARERGLRLIPLPGHRRAPGSWIGDGASDADDLTALVFWVPDIAERDVYACGPQEWTDALRRTTEAAGVPAERFHAESFEW